HRRAVTHRDARAGREQGIDDVAPREMIADREQIRPCLGAFAIDGVTLGTRGFLFVEHFPTARDVALVYHGEPAILLSAADWRPGCGVLAQTRKRSAPQTRQHERTKAPA